MTYFVCEQFYPLYSTHQHVCPFWPPDGSENIMLTIIGIKCQQML